MIVNALFIIKEGDSMTDVEKRRRRLLEDVRKDYSDKNPPPAIHPRYAGAYHSLYKDEFDEQSTSKSTFFLRLIVATFIFACFLIMDYNNKEVVSVSSQTIVNEVQKDLFGQ